jgi:hypothetical protein
MPDGMRGVCGRPTDNVVSVGLNALIELVYDVAKRRPDALLLSCGTGSDKRRGPCMDSRRDWMA